MSARGPHARDPAWEDLVVLGAIARPHGVRGEMRLHPFNPESELLWRSEELWVRVGENGPPLRYEVRSLRGGPKGVPLLSLVGVAGREAAEALRGAEVAVPVERLPPPGHGEWYLRDLVGSVALDSEGQSVGRVLAVETYPTIDCLRIEGEGGEIREVPMADPWFVDADPRARRVYLGARGELPDPEPVPSRRR